MKANVTVSVNSELIYAQDIRESISQSAQGVRELLGSLLRISYISEEKDFSYKTDIILFAGDNSRVRVRRTGDIRSDMLFENGREHIFEYAASGLCLEASVITHALSVNDADGLIKIDVEYTLKIGGEAQRSRLCYVIKEL